MWALIQIAALMAFLLVLFALVGRFLIWMAQAEMRELERLATDPVYRAETLRRMDGLLAERPDDLRLLRRRADVRHMDDDAAGVVEDLSLYLRARPAEDTAWAELAEALLDLGDAEAAARAAARAREIDPAYSGHRPLGVRAALAAEDPDHAAALLDDWEREAPPGERVAKTDEPDPRIELLRCEIALRRDDAADARARLRAAAAAAPGLLAVMLDEWPEVARAAVLAGEEGLPAEGSGLEVETRGAGPESEPEAEGAEPDEGATAEGEAEEKEER